jgi:hypothetical protein
MERGFLVDEDVNERIMSKYIVKEMRGLKRH